MNSIKPPCSFFAKNACNNGENCRFSHDIAPLVSSSKTVCSYFLKGDCRYGDKCLNVHSRTSQDFQPSLCKFFIKGECKNGSDCVYRHEKGPASRSPHSTSLGPEIADRGLSCLLAASRRSIDITYLASNSNSPLFPLGSVSMLQINSATQSNSTSSSPGTSVVPMLDSVNFSNEPEGNNASSNEGDINVTNGDTQEVTSDDERYSGFGQQESQTLESSQIMPVTEVTEVYGEYSPEPGSIHVPYTTPSTFFGQNSSTGVVVHAAPYYDPNLYARTQSMVPNYTRISYFPHNYPGVNDSPALVASTPSGKTKSSLPWCQQHIAYGFCQFGTSCKFRHYLTDYELQKLSAERDEVPRVERVQGEPRAERAQETPGVSYNKEYREIIHRQNKEECRFWKTGSCKRGDSCRYSHADPGAFPVIEDNTSSPNHGNDYFGCGSTSDAVAIADASDRGLHAPAVESWGDSGDWGDASVGWDIQPSASPSNGTSGKGPEKRNGDDDGNRREGQLGTKSIHSQSSSGSRDSRSGSSNRFKETRRKESRRRGRETTPHLHGKGRRSRWDDEDSRGSDKARPQSSTRSSVEAGLTGSSRWPDADELTSEPSNKSPGNDEIDRVSPSGDDQLNTALDEPPSGSWNQTWEQSARMVGSEQTMENSDKGAYDPDSSGSDGNVGLTHDSIEGQDGGIESTTDYVGEKNPTTEGDNMGWTSGDTQSSINWDTADDSWNASNWDQSESEDYYHGPRKKLPCKAFGQGYCSWGDACWYLHVPPEGDVDGRSDATMINEINEASVPTDLEREDIMSPSTTITRQSFHCEVKYSQNACPEQILTAFESNAMFVFDVPFSFGEDELSGFVSRFGMVREIQVEFLNTGDTCYRAKVTFADKRDAEEAVKHLHEHSDLGSKTVLRAYLDSKAPNIYNWHPSQFSPSVKLSYPTPSRTAWVYFESMDFYKKAEGLNGEILNGRKIKIPKLPRLKKQTYLPLRVEGLSMDTEKKEILAFFKNSVLVEMISPTYIDNPANQLETLLQACGELEQLVLDTSFPSEKTRAVGFARFSDADAAAGAVANLNDTVRAFLGDGRLSVQSIFYWCYHLSRQKISVVRGEIESLQKIHSSAIKVQECVQLNGDVELRIYGTELIPFAEARRDFDVLMKGEIVLNDDDDNTGRALWDDYFDLPSGTKQLDQLNTRHTGSFFIERDFRNRHVLVFGNKERRTLAKDVLQKLLAKVQNCVLTVGVSDSSMGCMIRAGYANERDVSDKLRFDFVSRVITIRGGADEREKEWAKISKFIEESDTSSSPTIVDQGSCRLCLSESSIAVERSSLGCEHKFCKRCLALWFKSTINPNFTPITCIAAVNVDNAVNGGEEVETNPRCSAPIPYSLIRKILSDEEQSDLLEHSFLSHIWTHPDEFKLCPTYNCVMAYRVGSPGSLIHCPECKKWICGSCHVEVHEGLTCSQYIDLTCN
ncbi:hypothetical protein J3R30DRAFT_3512205 [Lentinula aciculospora]|uniref:RING-type E3 ubiquitin transferase n=1 Tax=Lentinula aciculospora TaxID=153920 RepID=A0A9W9DJQ8_9AGAR|nr:hypothetical protein J3R30DRAFT_3512205 [Lentinula aciculospora]